MKIHYYTFPEGIPMEKMKELAVRYGLTVHSQRYRFSPNSMDDFDELERLGDTIIRIDRQTSCCKLSEIKKLLRKYGGEGCTEFFNKRDGEFYGCVPIHLEGKNQRVGYIVK